MEKIKKIQIRRKRRGNVFTAGKKDIISRITLKRKRKSVKKDQGIQF